MNTRTHAAIALAAFGACITIGLCAMEIADQREGHAWCDGAALSVRQPVKACMAAYNTFGANGVIRWARPYAVAILAQEAGQ